MLVDGRITSEYCAQSISAPNVSMNRARYPVVPPSAKEPMIFIPNFHWRSIRTAQCTAALHIWERLDPWSSTEYICNKWLNGILITLSPRRWWFTPPVYAIQSESDCHCQCQTQSVSHSHTVTEWVSDLSWVSVVDWPSESLSECGTAHWFAH